MNTNTLDAPKILIVDDDPACIEVLLQLLSYERVQLQASRDGASALSLARSWQPDLILLDVEMPEVNGYDVCHLLKQDPATTGITVLFVTGMSDVQDETKGLQLGAVDYIVKPFEFSVLKARVRNHLELHQKNQALVNEAMTDGLTGVPNRRCFETVLTQEWNRCARYGRPLSMMMIDIDCFKRYNDHFGHPQGDLCLQAVARMLQDGLRRASDLVARIGGEEFAVLLPEMEEADMLVLAEQLRRRVESEAIEHVPTLEPAVVTVSIGCCTVMPELGQGTQAMMLSADNNLYQAKSLGRNQVVVACNEGAIYS